jgi:tRNA(Arg) A34 adenosine deaminase TadA
MSDLSPTASDLDLEMMTRALALARRAAAVNEVPVGAVVYHTDSGRVLGEAFNRRHLDRDPTAHAELLAIREAAFALGDWRLNDCSLAVTLEPCCMCAGLIVNARVGRLLYGAVDPKAGAVESLYHLTTDERLNHRVVPIAGVLGAESGALLREFFQNRRNTGR